MASFMSQVQIQETAKQSFTEEGIRTLKISLIGLMITGVFQLFVVYISSSAALLADTIHNFADAMTAIPLWIAFSLSRRKPTRNLTYGYGRSEDIAGILILFVIIVSAVIAVYESILKFQSVDNISHIYWVMAAAVIGFIGNEIVAQYRIKTGEKIGSAALVADGKHSRIDGLTSLGVLVGAVGVSLGYPILDPIIGVVISLFIFGIVVETSKEIFKRLMDVVDPKLLDEVEKIVKHVNGVKSVHDVKARWVGHELRIDLSIAVPENLSVSEGHHIAVDAHNLLIKNIPHLSNITIHVDPDSLIGESKHNIT